jgi:ATP-dependent Clp protease ATP-binding subunit ClpA
MADQFDKFTEQTKRVLIRSQQEAKRLHHDHIGTEHLRLGLIGEKGGGAAQVLAHLGVTPPQVRQAVERGLERGERPVGGDVRLTPGAKRVIERTVGEARRREWLQKSPEERIAGRLQFWLLGRRTKRSEPTSVEIAARRAELLAELGTAASRAGATG